MPVSASYLQDQCYDDFSIGDYIKGDFSFKLLGVFADFEVYLQARLELSLLPLGECIIDVICR